MNGLDFFARSVVKLTVGATKTIKFRSTTFFQKYTKKTNKTTKRLEGSKATKSTPLPHFSSGKLRDLDMLACNSTKTDFEKF